MPCRTDDRLARMAAVNGAHRPPDALAPLINVRREADGDKLKPNVTTPGLQLYSARPVTRVLLAHPLRRGRPLINTPSFLPLAYAPD